jgi:dTDP-4-dehydrorhamnose reductase
MSRILITGSAGFLGHVLCEEIDAYHDVFAGFLQNRPESYRARPLQLDVTDEASIRSAVVKVAPDLVVHSAAIASSDDCELNPTAADRVNVFGSSLVAKVASEMGCRLVHISTDLVFDGFRGNYREADEVRGINVYARSKIAAEREVNRLSPPAVILRVSILYGWGPDSHPGAVRRMLQLWREGTSAPYFYDQFRTPTSAPQVARVIEELLRRPEVSGIFHVGGADRISRLDFARMVARAAGADEGLLKPVSMYDGPGAAARARDCSLDSTRLELVMGISPVACQDGIERVLGRSGGSRRHTPKT